MNFAAEPSSNRSLQPPLSRRPDPWLAAAAILIAVGLSVQFKVLFQTWRLGGHEWIQGDWLISLAAGPIRRGGFGQMLLMVSDWLALSPLDLLVGVQAILVGGLFAGFLRIVLLQSRSSMALTVFSPGCFVLLWAIDPISSLRKEMIGLLALVWLAQPNGGTARLALSGALMILGGLAHELTLLLLPAWLIATWLFQPRCLASMTGKAIVAVVTLAAAAELAYAVHYRQVADAGPICDALAARGLSPSALCGGAIAWLSDPANGWPKVWQALHRSWTAWLLPLAWAVAAAPLYRLWSTSKAVPPRAGLLVLAAAAPICLLYPIGLDWGRWFAIQFTVCATLVLGLSLSGQLIEVRRISSRECLIWLLLALPWGLRHDPVVVAGGFLALLPG